MSSPAHAPEPSVDPSLLPPAPVLPEPVPGQHQDQDHNPQLAEDIHAAAAHAAIAAVVDEGHHLGGGGDEQEQGADGAVKFEEGAEGAVVTKSPRGPKKRRRKLLLSFHEALTFASRGVYVDLETGQLRCSCNHKPCDKWDAYGYTRHFEFKCHKKYEEQRLDDAEIARLREAKATYLRMHPQVEEQSIRKRRRTKDGEKMLSVDELRVQERHWMEMWKDSKNELKQLRQDLKVEVDEEVRAELMADIEGLKKRKGDWARLLGLNETVTDISAIF